MNGINKRISEGEGSRIFRMLRIYILSGDTRSDNFKKEYKNAASLLRSDESFICEY